MCPSEGGGNGRHSEYCSGKSEFRKIFASRYTYLLHRPQLFSCLGREAGGQICISGKRPPPLAHFLDHIDTALRRRAYRPLGRCAFSYLRAELRTFPGEKIREDVTRTSAFVAVKNFDWQVRQCDIRIQAGYGRIIPILDGS